MDIRTLSYFVEIAQSGTITEAANKLHISQPPLSRSMQLLEEELGVQLLIRGKRKVTLTPEGQFLLGRAQQMLALSEKTMQQINELGNKVTGKIYIGSIESISLEIMPALIAGFHELYPEVEFNWWSGNSNDVLDRLSHGLLDFAVVRTPCNNEKFDIVTLYKEPWMVYLSQEHFSKMQEMYPGELLDETLPLQYLDGVPLIVPSIKTRAEEIRNWFMKREIDPKICCEISPAMNALSLVEAGMGAAILPKAMQGAAASRHILTREIVDPVMESEIILAYHKEMHISTAARKFMEYLQEHLSEKE